VEFTADTARLNRKIIGLPDGLARLQARVMEWVPGKPFSRDNYLSLQTDSVCSEEESKQPTSIEAVVPRYLGNGDINGRLQARRRWARR
jgi:NADH dehydrogenase